MEFSGSSNIANLFASNLRSLLHLHFPAVWDTLHDSIKSSISSSQLQDVVITLDDVVEAIHLLKKQESQMSWVFLLSIEYMRVLL